MKTLVTIDEHCFKLRDKFYLSQSARILINRYLCAYDFVRLAVRVQHAQAESELSKHHCVIDDPRIEVFEIPFFQGPVQYAKKYLSIKKNLRNVCNGCSLAIFRLPSTVGFAVWSVALKNKLPYATELVFDCSDAMLTSQNFIGKMLWVKMHRSQQKACEHAIGVAPVTEFYMQQHYFSKKEQAINSHYSSIELEDKHFYHKREYPESKDALTVIHVANHLDFKDVKGSDVLIDAMGILKKRGVIINACIVGEDRYGIKAKLEKYAQERDVLGQITFTGFLEKSKLFEKYKECDIAILPTKAEGLPRVVIESMAMGLPCVISNVSGNPELVDDDMLFENGNLARIADIIESLVKNKKLYEKTSEENFNRSRQYAKEVLDGRRTEFYNKLKELVN